MIYPCRCCASPVFFSPPDGDYSVCPVCGWEDDPVQFADPDCRGGANEMSLNDAKRVCKGDGSGPIKRLW
ncbi:CPCC family cysteine-rich protein [Herbaspirillum seropedicae]|uniref:CPCC family cysteine-rich protein n=1 Tax=Herbaspirillum seropedicae TaxID=964 RepID=UPI000863B342|nr:CPCC family cysteine-rich protein [Herbaspirillum seropedicae]AON55491.1 hydrolase [Herbaspirillum seropedicae]